MAIYNIWCGNAFLRDSELGLGIIGGESAGDGWYVPIRVNTSPRVSNEGKSAYSFPPECAFFAARTRCDFDPKRGNYESFAEFYKVLPLIVPEHVDGTHHVNTAIYAFGPGSGLMCICAELGLNGGINAFYSFSKFWDGEIIADSGGVRLVQFAADKAHRRLQSVGFVESAKEPVRAGQGAIRLYPIPFSAASNVEWRGQSFSTNVASISDLKSALEHLRSKLTASKAWGFSSDEWPDNWSPRDYYSYMDVKRHAQYIGLLDEDA